MKIADMKVTELINAVGSDAPAPGGGAVAGLAGGIGVALTMMVNGLTLSKKGFEDDRERILDAIAKGNELKERFVDVMNRDSEVFDVLIESLALPKENDAQKAIRRGAVQASFRNCTEVPLTMMEVCLESIDLLATLVGTVQGGIQALSRSYFGQIIPPERSNEYFGFLDIFGKFSCVIGPALYSLVYTLTSRASLGILSIILLFLCGGVALLVGRKHVFAPHAMEAMKG